ncbi:MAG: hypothetical protein FWE97_01620, partial [Dehalococcoidia bacterium]|nr:hypothetical protein [Dehalococcoidia bacterium]
PYTSMAAINPKAQISKRLNPNIKNSEPRNFIVLYSAVCSNAMNRKIKMSGVFPWAELLDQFSIKRSIDTFSQCVIV